MSHRFQSVARGNNCWSWQFLGLCDCVNRAIVVTWVPVVHKAFSENMSRDDKFSGDIQPSTISPYHLSSLQQSPLIFVWQRFLLLLFSLMSNFKMPLLSQMLL